MPKELKSQLPSSSVFAFVALKEAASRATAPAAAIERTEQRSSGEPKTLPQQQDEIRTLQGEVRRQPVEQVRPGGLAARSIAPAVLPQAALDPMVTKDICLSLSTKATLQTLVTVYQRGTGTSLSASHIVRALLMAAQHCLGNIEHEAGRLGGRSLPSNAVKDEARRKQFEAELADSLVAAFRASSVYQYPS